MKEGGYKRLMRRFERLSDAIRYPRTSRIWCLNEEDLKKGWLLTQTLAQVQVANSAGWDVRLRSDGMGGLLCEMVKRPDNV
jgi:hypothetical protein